MIDAKKLANLTDDVKANLVVDMKKRLVDQVNKAIINAMSDQKIDEFNTFMDNDHTDQEVQDFIANSGVDTQKVAAQAMLAFRDLYLQTPAQRVTHKE